jgi:hypothetical protein
VLAGLALPPDLQAHSLVADPIPETPGWRAGAGIAAGYLHADDPVPSRMLPGVLLIGEPAHDRRSGTVEHMLFETAGRLNDHVGGVLAVGWHGDGSPHVEAAWVEGRHWSAAGLLSYGAGRLHVPIGHTLKSAGRFDRFSQVPLAKRAAFNDDWYETGVNLRWEPDTAWRTEVNLGLWRGTAFPGAADGTPVPALHVGTQAGAWRLDGFAARVRADGRGTHVQRTDAGHSHGAPRCDESLRQIVCLDGDADLLGGNVAWESDDHRLRAVLAGLARRERGALYSQNGDARYSGRTYGGWAELSWDLAARWSLATRLEAVSARHRLAGPGSTFVAGEAGLLDAGTTRRQTVSLEWRPSLAGLRLFLEAGQERITGERNPFVGLRFIWIGTVERALGR